MELSFKNQESQTRVKKNEKFLNESQREFTFLSWNIGYAGLGKEMDFFYDGGGKVRPSKEQFENYLSGIKKTLKENNKVDFIFLQEVDISSKRSYYVDEFYGIVETLKDFFGLFTLNYKCNFVPVPFLNPMGKVLSGIVNLSQTEPNNIEIHYFKASFSWPKKLFLPKRGYSLLCFNLDNGKDLVVFNVHNSAYDEGAELRKEELLELGLRMEKEYFKGNYVVAGGDWNMNPRNFDKSMILSGDNVFICNSKIEMDFLPNWNFVFDKNTPSNRNVDMPYEKGKTGTTTMDFFVVSPNIEIEKVEIFNTNFEYSDHQPVMMNIKLK